MGQDLECLKCSARFNSIIWYQGKITHGICPNCDDYGGYEVMN